MKTMPIRALSSWALTAMLVMTGCSERERVPADMDPRQPWVTSSAAAKQMSAAAPAGIVDEKLFTVEAVMRHQHALGITADQKASILRELDAVQTELNRLEWALNGDKEKLADALSGHEVDEAVALEAGQRVTEQESKIKMAHLRLLIRVKNTLRVEQQDKLRSLAEITQNQ